MANRVDSLTQRQIECLRGKWDHKLDKQIAEEMGIATRRVEGHLSAAREKLGVSSSRQAMEIAATALGWAGSEKPPPVKTALPKPDLISPLPVPEDASGKIATADREPDAIVVHRWLRSQPVPWRWTGVRQNDLTTTARTLWILAIAIGIPIGLVLVLALSDYVARIVTDIIRLVS